MHVSITACTLILTPRTTGVSLLLYGVVFAAGIWVVIAVIAVGNSRRPSLQPLRRQVA
jgi:hypothetical protein